MFVLTRIYSSMYTVLQGIGRPKGLDDVTDRANLVSLYYLLWRGKSLVGP